MKLGLRSIQYCTCSRVLTIPYDVDQYDTPYDESRYGAVPVALAISYDEIWSMRRSPYDGNCSTCDTVWWKSLGRYGAVLLALAILYDGNWSIRRSPCDGNWSSCNIVQWKLVDTTFAVWWRSIQCRTGSSCNIVRRFCCRCRRRRFLKNCDAFNLMQKRIRFVDEQFNTILLHLSYDGDCYDTVLVALAILCDVDRYDTVVAATIFCCWRRRFCVLACCSAVLYDDSVVDAVADANNYDDCAPAFALLSCSCWCWLGSGVCTRPCIWKIKKEVSWMWIKVLDRSVEVQQICSKSKSVWCRTTILAIFFVSVTVMHILPYGYGIFCCEMWTN